MTDTRKPSDAATSVVIAGCGAMGYPMALQLYAHGVEIAGFDVRSEQALIDEHKSTAPFPLLSSLEYLKSQQILWVVVRDETQINDLCFDQQAVYTQKHYPKTLVISSTVAPEFIHTLNDRLPNDVTLVDAPMSGAPYAAKSGSLTFMVGGDKNTIATLQPYLNALGSNIHHIGATGAGMLMKVMNNYVAASSVVAVRRCLSRAAARGIDPEQLLSIMSQSSGATWYGDHAKEIEWAQQPYDPDNTIGILIKDVNCALSASPTAPDAFDDALLEALQQLPPWPTEFKATVAPVRSPDYRRSE